MTFSFVIEGKPTAKQRPRFSGHRTYTPAKTIEFEKKVREAYLNQGGIYFGDKPLEVHITFIFPIAKSWSKKKREDALHGRLKMTSRPDTDNLSKSVMDSLNGIAYKDDSQIINLIANKEYGEEKTIVWLKSV